jgi:hypothetical protein
MVFGKQSLGFGALTVPVRGSRCRPLTTGFYR